MKLFPAALVTTCVFLFTACSHNGNKTVAPTQVCDSTLYEMGRSHAANMFSTCGDSTSLRTYLLDTQAKLHEIEQKNGRQSAYDYRHGFEEYVKFYDPVLAAEIL